jgi:membrane protease YdiL (CAAX protease family)
LWWQSWAIAFALGIFGVSVLYGLQLILGWGSWNSPSLTKALYFLLEGTLVGFGVGLAEELIFRAWLLFELETDYSPPVALGINALIFAIAHYFRPLSAIAETWPQAVGLFLLGMTLVWARRIPLRLPHHPLPITVLGFPAGLHGGLVWAYYQVDVNDLIVIDPHIPAWLTGIGGNPLAGVLGLALLSGITAIAYRASHSHLLQETH